MADIIKLPTKKREEKLAFFVQLEGMKSFVIDAFHLPDLNQSTSKAWSELGKKVVLFLTDEAPLAYRVLKKIGRSGAGKYENRKGTGSGKSKRTNIRTVLFRELAKAFGAVTKKEPKRASTASA